MIEKKELAVIEPAPVTPMALLQSAQQSGASIEQMQQLMELQFKWEANEARKAYNAAIAAFKAEGVKIVKNKHVRFQTNKGTTEYDHATLGNVVEQITKAMSRHDLSNTWSVDQDQTGIRVTCKISHVMGHSDSVSIKAEADDSGGKNRIQQVASTITYLQRYTLLSALGLATHDQDDDGRHSEAPKEPTISEHQAAELRSLLKEVKGEEKTFCTFLKVAELEDLPAKYYDSAVRSLEKRRGA